MSRLESPPTAVRSTPWAPTPTRAVIPPVDPEPAPGPVEPGPVPQPSPLPDPVPEPPMPIDRIPRTTWSAPSRGAHDTSR